MKRKTKVELQQLPPAQLVVIQSMGREHLVTDFLFYLAESVRRAQFTLYKQRQCQLTNVAIFHLPKLNSSPFLSFSTLPFNDRINKVCAHDNIIYITLKPFKRIRCFPFTYWNL